jgi:hypothetical protein
VVCSRLGEYSALAGKLALEGAITLQPLTPKQINAYFERFAKSLAGVKGLLKKDKALQELAETPLMLSIMALAYKDRQAGELVTSGNLEKQREHLFGTYITRMFERSTRRTNVPFPKQQTLHSLHWLARMMIQHNIITYQIETMQPQWLEAKSRSRLYRLFFRLSVGLMGGLIAGLVAGLSFGLSVGLMGGLMGPQRGGGEIIMVDKLKWSWKEAGRGLIAGLISGLIFGLIAGLSVRLSVGLIFGLSVWLSIGLMGGLITGLIHEQIEETTRPGQRLKQTLFNAVFFGLITGLSVGLSGRLSNWLNDSLIADLSVILNGALSGLLAIGLISTGNALLQHFVLRFVLARYQLLPWHLLPFLEHAVDLIFLRRVGGSYIFVHRTLMEHFAEMDV